MPDKKALNIIQGLNTVSFWSVAFQENLSLINWLLINPWGQSIND